MSAPSSNNANATETSSAVRALSKPDCSVPADVVPAQNFEARRDGLTPELLVMHYTGMASAERAIYWLGCAESRVSCHYVVDCDGRITQMVAEDHRAWHAGQSMWHGETDINSKSIGIEIQNPGHEDGYDDFPDAQMAAVLALSQDIIARHAIRADGVVAHSDIAPGRKIDPGEKFNWEFLARNGVGLWVPPAEMSAGAGGHAPGHVHDEIAVFQRNLATYGYGVAVTGANDRDTARVTAAFQRHFRPARVDGIIDPSTRATLVRLLDARAVLPSGQPLLVG